MIAGAAAVVTGRPRLVLALWLLIVAGALGVIVTCLPSALTNERGDSGNYESQRADELIAARLPARVKASEVVVIQGHAPDAYVASVAARLRAADVRVLPPVSAPGATMIPVALTGTPEESVDTFLAAVDRTPRPAGVTLAVTGDYTAGKDFGDVSEQDLRHAELRYGLPAAIVALLLVFGTLAGAAVPVTMALVSIIVSLALVAVVGQLFKLNLFVTNMVVAMGLALGIDYSLFILSRLREERARGADTRAAIVTAAATASRAVVFSGIGFSLAMIGMLLMSDTILRSLAFGAVVVGLVSVTVAVAFLPALLMALGDGVERLRVPWLGHRVASSSGREGRFWGRIAAAVLRRPGLSLLATTALLLVAGAPALGLQIGSSGWSSLPDSARAKQGARALEQSFPAGVLQPVRIVIRDPGDVARVRAYVARDPDFAARATTVRSGNGLTVLVVPLTVEASSPRAADAIGRLRASAGPDVLVGGAAAEGRDYVAMVKHRLPIVIASVLSLSFLLLLLVFRSALVALAIMTSTLLSLIAAYGLLVLVFQHGYGASVLGFDHAEQIEAWVPVFLFAVLFGLSTDYQIFVLSRVEERYHRTGSLAAGVRHGVGSTARIITGAAAIVVVVFGGFAAGQLVVFQEMGFGVAVALLLDATLVRSVAIPAAVALLGERHWRHRTDAAPGSAVMARSP